MSTAGIVATVVTVLVVVGVLGLFVWASIEDGRVRRFRDRRRYR